MVREDPLKESAHDRPLVIDELSSQFEQFRVLRRGADEAATGALLDELGAHDPVDQMAMLRARRDADRVAEGYKGIPLGVLFVYAAF